MFAKNTDNGRVRADISGKHIDIRVREVELHIDLNDTDKYGLGADIINTFEPGDVKEIILGCFRAIKRVTSKPTLLFNSEALVILEGEYIAKVGNNTDGVVEAINFGTDIEEAIEHIYTRNLDELSELVGDIVSTAYNMLVLKEVKLHTTYFSDMDFEMAEGDFNSIEVLEDEDDKRTETLDDVLKYADKSKRPEEQSDDYYKRLPYVKGQYKEMVDRGLFKCMPDSFERYMRMVARAHGDNVVGKENKTECSGCGACKQDNIQEDIVEILSKFVGF